MIVKSKRHRSGGAQDEPLGSYIFVKVVTIKATFKHRVCVCGIYIGLYLCMSGRVYVCVYAIV